MRVLFSPDKFAGTMSAHEAADAMASGWSSARPGDEVRIAPMADGGPGSVDVVSIAVEGIRHITPTVDQLGRPVAASWLEVSGSVALVESSEACGLHLVPPDERDPMKQTTHGLGILLRQVIQSGFSTVMIGMGGTGTVDGGLGAVAALGAQVLDRDGKPMHAPTPQDCLKLGGVGMSPDLGCELVVLVDVNNPLLGDRGAARVFGPQKGASETDVLALEKGLGYLADLVESGLPGGPWRDLPGSGAAGGLAFGLMAWVNATVLPGAATIAELVGLDDQIAWADVVVTGEGRIDDQTSAGKVPGFVAQCARAAGTPVFAIAGDADVAAIGEFDMTETLGPGGLVEPISLTRAAASRLASRLEADQVFSAVE